MSVRCSAIAALLIAAILTGGPQAVHSQTATMIRGEVREALEGAPLPGSMVRVLGTSEGTLTDADGRFALRLAHAGSAEIQVTRLGFVSQTRMVSDVGEVGFLLEPSPVSIGEIRVVGRRQGALARIPGSAVVVSPAVLAATVPMSANEVLRTVTGVHVQEEEGLGLRANIGIRGLDPDRSRNVLILEDGVPVALNPYGEPEMYYSPPIDRMEGVEVVKGSGSIMFGPQTVGGVINYRTPAPPLTPSGRISVLGGEGGFRRVLGSYGGTWNRVGGHVSVLNRAATDIRGHHFDVYDVTGRIGYALDARSELGLKGSLYDEHSNSTYVGLTEEMFALDPNQHPAPDDRLAVRRQSVTATHSIRLTDNVRLQTAAYAYATTRNWQRQDYRYIQESAAIELLNGVGNRNRSFRVAGVEPRLQSEHVVFGVRGEMDAGARLLFERAEEIYVEGTPETPRQGLIRDHELRGGEAVSAFVQNRFILGDLEVVPGVRVESFRFDRRVLRTRVRRTNPETGATTRAPEDVDIHSGDRILEVVPGIGATWRATDRLIVFGGVHRGFAPPRTKDALVYSDATVPIGEAPGDVISLQLDSERSVNSEFGVRSIAWPSVNVEVTAFLLDFSNQIIAASASAGSVSDLRTANQGETRHTGIEAAIDVDIGQMLGWSVGVIPSLRHTFVRSTFSADRWMRPLSGSDLLNVRGNRLPYAPENVTVLGLRVEHPAGFGVSADGTFTAAQFSDNFETREATANGRLGLIPAYRLVNIAGTYDIPVAGVTLVGSVKNLLGETHIVSRRPEGIRASTPRMLQIGAHVAF